MDMEEYSNRNKKANSNTDKITRLLLVVYLIALVWILLFKLGVRFTYMENRNVNLIPFYGSSGPNQRLDPGEILMNVIVFMPFGIYMGILFKSWSFRKSIAFFFLVSLIFETLQYIFKVGAFDITDTITNTFGGIIGLMLFKVVEIIFSSSLKAQKVVNIVAATGTILMILFLILLKTNNLWIRYQ